MPNQEESTATSMIQRARRGELAALEPVIRQMAPLLHAQAANRLGPRLSSRIDPDDLVQSAWLVALQKLPALEARNGSLSAVLFQFVAKTILHLANNLARRAARELAAGASLEGAADQAAAAAFAAIETEGDSAFLSRLRSKGSDATVSALISNLSRDDRQLVIMRLEGATFRQAGAALGLGEDAARMRHRRILQRLRQAVPGGIFAEFEDS